MSESNVLRDTEYELRQPDGELVAVKVRRDFKDGGKTFWFRRASGTLGLNGQSQYPLPLYRSHLVNNDDWVVIAEGEKATDAIAEVFPAIGTGGSSSIPTSETLNFLKGKTVTLWPDHDDVGLKHMTKLAEQLHKLGITVRIVNVSDIIEKGDAADVPLDQRLSYILGSEDYSAPVSEAQPHVYNSSDLKKMFLRESEHKWEAQQSGKRLNLLSGFSQLDNITSGLEPGLIAIHGQPGVGKTAFALQIARQCDAPTLYLTAEMSIGSLLKRLVASTTKTPLRHLLSAILSPEEEEAKLEATLQATPKVQLVDASTQAVRLSYLRETMADLKLQDDGHALLVIDSLHTWINMFLVEAPGSTEYEAINNGVINLRSIANDLRIPIIIICERNRTSMKEGGLSAVAGSRIVEYRSDVVLSLDKAEEQSDPHGITKDIEVTVLKTRSGAAGLTVPFSFDGSIQRYSEL